MSSKKISELTATATTNSTDETVLAVSGTSRKVTLSNLINGIIKYCTTSAKGLTGVDDSNGNEVVKFTGVASAVNEVTITNAASGSAPSITSTGGDTNIDLPLRGKGTGQVTFGTANIKLPNSDGTAGFALMTDGSGSSVFRVKETSGIKSIAGGTASGNQTIAHGLGRAPTMVKFTCYHSYSFSSGGGGNGTLTSSGFWDGTNEGHAGTQVDVSSGAASGGAAFTSASKIGSFWIQNTSASTRGELDVTGVDTTNITFNIPSTVEDSNGALIIRWEAS